MKMHKLITQNNSYRAYHKFKSCIEKLQRNLWQLNNQIIDQLIIVDLSINLKELFQKWNNYKII